ncbi:MAG: METTL5 family protein [Candidatus Jordarchaeum sp.]|uniref:METTL5 family protein n=1 Tax=Candidatus Jordarchaeum sp. TaxID=2823881 RepID=UPI0040497285
MKLEQRFKKKDLERLLSELRVNPSPKVSWEQYASSSEVAANLLFIAAFTFNDIVGCTVFDLGCGNGMLGIGAALIGAKRVVGVDLDSKVLRIARRNSLKMGVSNLIDFIAIDVANIGGSVDTILQNPPFGVQKRSSDRIFLKKAIELANVAYTIHKYGLKNRKFISQFVKKNGGIIDRIIRMKMGLPPTFHFHTKRKYMVDIDIYRILNAGKNILSHN